MEACDYKSNTHLKNTNYVSSLLTLCSQRSKSSLGWNLIYICGSQDLLTISTVKCKLVQVSRLTLVWFHLFDKNIWDLMQLIALQQLWSTANQKQELPVTSKGNDSVWHKEAMGFKNLPLPIEWWKMSYGSHLKTFPRSLSGHLNCNLWYSGGLSTTRADFQGFGISSGKRKGPMHGPHNACLRSRASIIFSMLVLLNAAVGEPCIFWDFLFFPDWRTKLVCVPETGLNKKICCEAKQYKSI